MDTSNRNFEQILLINRTLPVVVLTMNLSIDGRIAPILGASQTLSEPATKEVVVYAECGGEWVNQTPRQVSRMGVDGSTPGDIHNSDSIENSSSPVLIGIFSTSSPCGLNASLQVANKRQSTSPTLVKNGQKLDAVIDGKLPDDLDAASVFSKVIGHKPSNGSSGDLYLL